MNKMLVTIGADPEGFVQVANLNTTYHRMISAIPFFSGNKQAPETLPSKIGTVIHDNVAVEFTVVPSKSIKEFINNIETVKNEVLRLLQERGGKTLSIDYNASSHYFDPAALNNDEAKTFGCDPDINAYHPQEPYSPPDISQVGSMRMTGGHVHVGTGGVDECVDKALLDPYGKLVYVKLLDLFLGTYIVSLENNFDIQAFRAKDRRRFYGKAGAFRVKNYGLEYRTPSSTWLSSKARIATTARLVNAVAEHFIGNSVEEASLKLNEYYKKYNFDEKAIQEYINSSARIKDEQQSLRWKMNIKKFFDQKVEPYVFT